MKFQLEKFVQCELKYLHKCFGSSNWKQNASDTLFFMEKSNLENFKLVYLKNAIKTWRIEVFSIKNYFLKLAVARPAILGSFIASWITQAWQIYH